MLFHIHSCVALIWQYFRSVVFLLHIALEIPLGVQGLWAAYSLPFLQLNNTALVMIKVPLCPGWSGSI